MIRVVVEEVERRGFIKTYCRNIIVGEVFGVGRKSIGCEFICYFLVRVLILGRFYVCFVLVCVFICK